MMAPQEDLADHHTAERTYHFRYTAINIKLY